MGGLGSYAGYKLGSNVIEPYLGGKLAPLWKDTTWAGNLLPQALPEIIGVSGGALSTEVIGQGGSKVTDEVKKSIE